MKPRFNIEDYKDKYVMHCDTKEKANAFCKYLYSVGRKWTSDCSYLEKNEWNKYEKDTCYNFNYGTFCDYNSYCIDYTILEFNNFDWSEEEEKENIMVKEFTKSMLQNGMVIETRDKIRFLVNGDILVGKGDNYNFDELENYEDDLTVFGNKYKLDKYDIVKVYTTNSYCIEHIFDDVNLILLWERQEEMENKHYVIKQPYIDEDGEENTIIKIHPNNLEGYHKSGANCPIEIEYDEYYGFGLTIDTAKEMIKDLQEIVDYMEKK